MASQLVPRQPAHHKRHQLPQESSAQHPPTDRCPDGSFLEVASQHLAEQEAGPPAQVPLPDVLGLVQRGHVPGRPRLCVLPEDPGRCAGWAAVLGRALRVHRLPEQVIDPRDVRRLQN